MTPYISVHEERHSEGSCGIFSVNLRCYAYRDADKSLAQPGRKQATTTKLQV